MTRQFPMLFSPAMVEALLAGRKTETRRILNPQPTEPKFKGVFIDENLAIFGKDGEDVLERNCEGIRLRARVGDLIWVKEAHYAFGWWETTDELTKKTQKPKRVFVRNSAKPVLFEAPADVVTGQPELRPGWYKRSSLFLPKQESRLTLRVTKFTIEQLHDIDEASAAAEGVERLANPTRQKYPFKVYGNRTIGDGCRSAKRSYQTLWDSINGFLAWHANPWVDVTKFDVLHQNVEQIATR